MRRLLLIALALCPATGALAQASLDASIGSGLGGGLGSGLRGGVTSGLTGTLGTTQTGRTRADQSTTGTSLNPGGCAPGQASLNYSGCRPIREFSAGSISSYDQSIEGMSPLRNLTLDPGSGPAMAGGSGGPFMVE